MVKADIFLNSDKQICGFDIYDHAEYADEGGDIICASVSLLVINTLNAIEKFTDDSFTSESEEGGARISMRLAMGLADIEENYPDNIDMIYEEV